MELNLKNKPELTFSVIGILMVIIVVLAVGFAINFLLSSVGNALDKETGSSGAIVRFQIDRAEAILRK